MSPVETAAAVTAVVALGLVALAAWVMYRFIPALPTEQETPPVQEAPEPPRQHVGRHRADEIDKPYRPRAAAPPLARATPALPLSDYAAAVGAKLPVPVPPPPARSADTAVIPTPPVDYWTDPHPEPCGYPDVVPCICRATPEEWFGVPNDETRRLDLAQ